jgi:hypothetical protein
MPPETRRKPQISADLVDALLPQPVAIPGVTIHVAAGGNLTLNIGCLEGNLARLNPALEAAKRS